VPATSRWRISDLLLDTRRQRVWRDACEIRLPKLTYDLLVTLARCHPTVISDEDLMKDVWPDLVVAQETVSQRVKLLREALGDDSRNPRYVARLRSRGYYLVGSVAPLPDADESPVPADATAVGAATTNAQELALLETAWSAGDCDRPEWAITQVIAAEVTCGLFPNLVDPAGADAAASITQAMSKADDRAQPPPAPAVEHVLRWVWALTGAVLFIAAVIALIVLHRLP